ncbi:hypothetical protein N7495_006774 [Penicillium taxi]|uniref:uncharacterized protein n=1 Tax=Penicillium taxi TaxID=168475 RepID=UPI0025453960|nr:uncharacterized protein N7495_006774 [Penicillium taxi]KAJ5895083.1 hypothetical protein N7495_006774 [Penicillium taxi]
MNSTTTEIKRLNRLLHSRLIKTILLVTATVFIFYSSIGKLFINNTFQDKQFYQQLERNEEQSDLQSRAFGKKLTWDDAKSKGQLLVCAMQKSDKLALDCFPAGKRPQQIASKFLSYSELSTWGWARDVEDVSEMSADESSLLPIERVLGISSSNSWFIKWIHDESVEVNNVLYESTGGFYNNAYNLPGGTIIADHSQSPAYTSYIENCDDGKPLVDPLVPLSVWSDVSFLEWQNLCSIYGASVQSLKHVVQSHIVNSETLEILPTALDESGTDVDWEKYKDGKKFTGGATFEALLGTPVASGTSWMLIQHKNQLGLKRIASITIMGQHLNNEYIKEWVPAMILTIEDV